MGCFWNSVTSVTCQVGRTLENQLPHLELRHDLQKFGQQVDMGLLAFVLGAYSCHVSVQINCALEPKIAN